MSKRKVYKPFYDSVTIKNMIKAVNDANYLIPRVSPYNGGQAKNFKKAIELLRQVEASLRNYKWITRKELKEINNIRSIKQE
jgi:hypothetical protein